MAKLESVFFTPIVDDRRGWPLGTGVISTAIKNRGATSAWVDTVTRKQGVEPTRRPGPARQVAMKRQPRTG
ncbi:MAG: hypothetical protein ACRDQ7_13330 [Haloechinothrix sp.]